MNIFDFYFKQIVTQSVMDWVFDQAQLADQNMAADNLLVGIVEGFEVNENNLGADMSVDILQGVAYSTEGQRTYNGEPLTNHDCSVDEFGVSTTVTSIGNERWLSVFARFTRKLEDPAIDGNGLEVYTKQYEDVEFIVRQSAQATISTATRPALIDGCVLLADINVAYGQTTIQTSHIDVSRRQDWIREEGSNLGTFVHGNSHDAVAEIFALVDSWATGSIPFSFSETWHGGQSVVGSAPPPATISQALNAIIYDLAKTTSTWTGADRIGIAAYSSSNVTWSATSARGAINTIAGLLNSIIGNFSTHAAGTAIKHSDTAILSAAKTGVPDSLSEGNVGAQLTELLNFANSKIPKVSPESNPSDWLVLWRSDDISANSSITANTQTIYWRGGGELMWVIGAYATDANEITANGAWPITAIYTKSAGNQQVNASGTSAAQGQVFSLSDPSSWDYYKRVLPGQEQIYGDFYQKMYSALKTVEQNFIPSTDTDLWAELFRQSTTKHRAHVGGAVGASGSDLLISHNCEWNEATSEWNADVSGSAIAVGVGTAGGFWIRVKNSATTWADDAWDAEFKFGGPPATGAPDAEHVNNSFSAFGKVFEKKVLLFTGYADVSGSPQTKNTRAVVNFTNRREDIPTNFDATLIDKTADASAAPALVALTGEIGCWGALFTSWFTFDPGSSGMAYAWWDIGIWE